MSGQHFGDGSPCGLFVVREHCPRSTQAHAPTKCWTLAAVVHREALTRPDAPKAGGNFHLKPVRPVHVPYAVLCGHAIGAATTNNGVVIAGSPDVVDTASCPVQP